MAETQSAEPPVAFVHIPKTAGGTIRSLLVDAYGREAVHGAGNYLSGPDRTSEKATKLPPGTRLTIGHTPFALFSPHLPPDTRYVTFLREPVDRVVSHYYRHLQGKSGTLVDALEQGLPHITNLMTRFLCNEATLDVLPPSALDEAKANLEAFVFVGFQERLDESALLMQEALGIPTIAYGASKHVNTERPSVEEIEAEERAVIAAHNQFDAELYAWARARFDTALEARSGELGGEVEALRSAVKEKVAKQEERTQRAVEWLREAAPPGSSRPIKELRAEGEAVGITTAEFNAARRQMPTRKVRSDPGVLLAVASEAAPTNGSAASRKPGAEGKALKREKKQRRRDEAQPSEEASPAKEPRVTGHQQHRVGPALEFLKRALPPGSARSLEELAADAEATGEGIRKADLRQAKRQLPGFQILRPDNGSVKWSVREDDSPVGDGLRARIDRLASRHGLDQTVASKIEAHARLLNWKAGNFLPDSAPELPEPTWSWTRRMLSSRRG